MRSLLIEVSVTNAIESYLTELKFLVQTADINQNRNIDRKFGVSSHYYKNSLRNTFDSLYENRIYKSVFIDSPIISFT